MSNPHWTAVFSAFMTPVIGIAVVTIGYFQWRLAQNKLKFDLFEKRYKVYASARRLISATLVHGQMRDEDFKPYAEELGEAQWLFNDEIFQYLDSKLLDSAIELQTLAAMRSTEADGSKELRENLARQTEIKKWMNTQFGELRTKLAPFLQLSHGSDLGGYVWIHSKQVQGTLVGFWRDIKSRFTRI